MTPTRSKLDRVPNYPMDPITQVLRTRPEALRDILKAFGGWIFRNKGWALPLWQEATESHKYAILSKRTYHWRMCLVGARRGRRGWLAELLLSSPTLRGYPQPERPLQLAKLIQSGETGEWPELQKVCTEESEILRKRLAGYPSPLPPPRTRPTPMPVVTLSIIAGQSVNAVNARDLHGFLEVGSRFNDWINSRVDMFGFVEHRDFETFTETSVKGRPSQEYFLTLDMAKELCMVERNEKGEVASPFSTTAQMAQTGIRFTEVEPGSTLELDGGSAPGAEATSRPLLECHGWPYEPDQAPNVVPFLRPWRGPRGDGGAA